MAFNQATADEIALSTGRKVYANCGIVGIKPADPGGGLSYGYDGSIPTYRDSEFMSDQEDQLSPAECVELADIMIAAWQQFRASHGL